MPQITPLELGLATAAVVLLFGPKKLPDFRGAKKDNSVDLSALVDQFNTEHPRGSQRPPVRGQFDVPAPQYGSGPNQAAAIRRAMPPVPAVAAHAALAAPQPVAYAAVAPGAPRAVAPTHPTAAVDTAPITDAELAPLKLPENA